MVINCLAIDDEPAALKLLVSYIKQTPFLNLVGEFDNAIDALREIHRNENLQLVFLDINMPDLSGIELARIIDSSDKKKNLRLIFTTAYDHYALEGFKVDALDYLLKPFSYVDFSKAAARALDYFDLRSNNQNNAIKTVMKAEESQPYIYLKVEHQLVKIDVKDILYIEGLKDYVKVFLQGKEKPLLTLVSLKKLMEKLPSDRFLRLHRSYIVSTDAIRSATRSSVIVGNTTIAVSDQYKDTFSDFLSKWTL
jgi:DNA-binding LytR/AlgR family response regulator